MPNYTYIFADLRTGAILSELPLYGVSMARELGKFGDWTGTVNLDIEGLPNQIVKDATSPGQTALFVDRDGVIIYAGVLWTRTYNAQGKALQMTGQDLTSYFMKRFISSRFSTRSWTATDQFTIAQSLLNQAQAATGGNIGVVVPSNTSGVLRDRTYPANELKPVAEAINQLSEVINGFDWEIDGQYDSNGVLQKVARFGYPYLGRSVATTDLVWEFPGNILTYWWSENASDSATTQWAVGSGDGDVSLMAVADDAVYVGAGWPILERQSSYSDVSIQATLDAHAQNDLRRSPMPVISPTIHVRADIEPVFGSFDLGDHALFEIEDPWFEEKFQFNRRILGWRLTPQSSSGSEFVALETGVPYGS